MPLNIPEGFGVAKLRWRSTGDAEEMISTIGFEWDGVASPQATATGISDAWVGDFLPAGLANTYTHVGCDVAIGPQGEAAVGEHNVNNAGTGAFAALPSNCALLVSKITAEQGKGSRGRMFLPAGYISEGECDQNGFLSGPALAGYQSSIFAFLEDAQTNGGSCPGVENWVLLHNVSSVIGAVLSPPTPITAMSVQTQIATQRQRMRR